MRIRCEYYGDGSQWVLTNTVNYIYDGMRVIQERDVNNAPSVSYTRGTDLSGTLEGAGGIGGLLARSRDFTICSTNITYWITNDTAYCISNLMIWDSYGTYVSDAYLGANEVAEFNFPGVAGRNYQVYGLSCEPYFIQVFTDGFAPTLDTRAVNFYTIGNDPYYGYNDSGNPLCDSGGIWLTHDYYHADGNGNITALVDTNQSLSATYRYDPYGNTISQSGSMANANVYRFSSKEIHLPTGLYYYGFRWYDPYLQRWLNRDPIQEQTGVFSRKELRAQAKAGWNLYSFCLNDPGNRADTDGRNWFTHLLSEIFRYGGFGGTCCNNTQKTEWWLDNGQWKQLPPGKCTGFTDDCDGLTCQGGFWPVSFGGSGQCNPDQTCTTLPPTSRPNPTATPTIGPQGPSPSSIDLGPGWTPGSGNGTSPYDRGAHDLPPDYVWPM
jgi:RHS repeat-associated protein